MTDRDLAAANAGDAALELAGVGTRLFAQRAADAAVGVAENAALPGLGEVAAGDAVVADVAEVANAGLALRGAGQVGTVMRVVTIGSRVITVVAVLATIGTMIYDGVEGEKQYDQLQGYVGTAALRSTCIY